MYLFTLNIIFMSTFKCCLTPCLLDVIFTFLRIERYESFVEIQNKKQINGNECSLDMREREREGQRGRDRESGRAREIYR